MDYYFNKSLKGNFEEVIVKVTEELEKEGFGVLTEINVTETLKKKLDVDFRNYRILGACNAPYAHKALEEFLGRAYNAGKRCVLVITGKGTLSQGGGILKNMVPHWLNELPNRGRILSFAYAKPRDGGTGALYILLKGKRS